MEEIRLICLALVFIALMVVFFKLDGIVDFVVSFIKKHFKKKGGTENDVD